MICEDPSGSNNRADSRGLASSTHAISDSVEPKQSSQGTQSPQSLSGLAGESCLEPLLGQTAAWSAGNGLFEFGVRRVFSITSKQKFSQELVARFVDRRRAEGDRELVLQAHGLKPQTFGAGEVSVLLRQQRPRFYEEDIVPDTVSWVTV